MITTSQARAWFVAYTWLTYFGQSSELALVFTLRPGNAKAAVLSRMTRSHIHGVGVQLLSICNAMAGTYP